MAWSYGPRKIHFWNFWRTKNQILFKKGAKLNKDLFLIWSGTFLLYIAARVLQNFQTWIIPGLVDLALLQFSKLKDSASLSNQVDLIKDQKYDITKYDNNNTYDRDKPLVSGDYLSSFEIDREEKAILSTTYATNGLDKYKFDEATMKVYVNEEKVKNPKDGQKNDYETEEKEIN